MPIRSIRTTKGANLDAIFLQRREQMSGFGGYHNDRGFSAKLGDYQSRSGAVFACVNERAKNLSHLPLRLWKQDNTGVRRMVTSGKLHDLLRKVNPYWTGQRLIDATERSLGFYGKSFWFINRKGLSGTPEIWWLHPGHMTVIPGKGYVEGYLYRDGNVEIPFRPEEIIWIPYFWTEDQFEGLSPLSAARLAADTSMDALITNRKFFRNGMHIGGIVSPKDEGVRFNKDQVQQLEQDLHRRLAGADKAHRWLVMSGAVDAKSLGTSPKDAEFLNLMNWGKTEICSVYSTPPLIIQHYPDGGITDPEAALKLFWTLCLIPEAMFLASEITEKLLPLYPGEADYAEFDTSGVKVLQEDQTEVVQQMGMLYNMRVPLNPLLRHFMPHLIPEGTDGYPWGDDPLELPGITGLGAAGDMRTITIEPRPVDPAWRNTPEGRKYLDVAKHGPEPVDDGSASSALKKLAWLLKTGRMSNGHQPAAVVKAADDEEAEPAIPEYGSPAHVAHMKALDNALRPWERKFERLVRKLFERQQEAVLAEVKRASGTVRKAIDPDDPFDRDEWDELFAEESLPLYRDITVSAGNSALRRVGVGLSFDVDNPQAQTALRRQAQRFAQQVNETTWQTLKDSLTEGIQGGEGIPDLEKRVQEVMGERIRSSAETIARTETGRAYSEGTVEGYRSSGVVEKKAWLSALDDRTREEHIDLHGQTVDLDGDFVVPEGPFRGARAPAPLQFSEPALSVNCRCTTVGVIGTPKAHRNGKPPITKAEDEEPTNFPQQGDNQAVSLDNSQWYTFSPAYAEDLKANWPTIWDEGGNIRGNEQFAKLLPIAKRGGTPKNDTEEEAIRLREAWGARHFEDFRLAGVVAQIKWLVVGSRGEKHMRELIEAEKDKIREREKETTRA